jgi:hypothetical protein
MKHPSAFVPIVMSAAALAAVIAQLAVVGTASQPDEGTVAHIWQILMAGQIPVVAFHAFRHVPRAPRTALTVLAAQVCAALAAMAPVYWLGW